jgi:hypothetical protein
LLGVQTSLLPGYWESRGEKRKVKEGRSERKDGKRKSDRVERKGEQRTKQTYHKVDLLLIRKRDFFQNHRHPAKLFGVIAINQPLFM